MESKDNIKEFIDFINKKEGTNIEYIEYEYPEIKVNQKIEKFYEGFLLGKKIYKDLYDELKIKSDLPLAYTLKDELNKLLSDLSIIPYFEIYRNYTLFSNLINSIIEKFENKLINLEYIEDFKKVLQSFIFIYKSEFNNKLLIEDVAIKYFKTIELIVKNNVEFSNVYKFNNFISIDKFNFIYESINSKIKNDWIIHSIEFSKFIKIIEDYNLRLDISILKYDETVSIQKSLINSRNVYPLELILLKWKSKLKKFDYNIQYFATKIEIDILDREHLKNLKIFNNILSAFESVEDVDLYVNEIKFGSLFSDFLLIFKTKKAKNRINNTLNVSGDILTSLITDGNVKQSESRKNAKEIDKINIENDILSNELESLIDPELNRQSKILDIEYKILMKQRAIIENNKLLQESENVRLNNIKLEFELDEMLSKKIANNLLDSENIILLVDGKEIIKKEKNNIIINKLLLE